MAGIKLSADEMSRVAEWLRGMDALSAATSLDLAADNSHVVLMDDGEPLVWVDFDGDGYKVTEVC